MTTKEYQYHKKISELNNISVFDIYNQGLTYISYLPIALKDKNYKINIENLVNYATYTHKDVYELIDEINKDILVKTSEISYIQSEVTGISDNVTNINSDISNINSDISVLTSEISVLNTKTDSLSVNKQDKLVSGNNIKTVNGNSLLGSGDIEIQVGDNYVTNEELFTEKEILPDKPYVDLGLPSGKLWATQNVGAANITDTGNYYSWAEITTKSDYSWTNYTRYAKGSYNTLTKYCDSSNYGFEGFTDHKLILEPMDDIATQTLGNGWYIPSVEDINELHTQCTFEQTTLSGIMVYKITGPNGNYIYIPCGGYKDGRTITSNTDFYCWTNRLREDFSSRAHCFNHSGQVDGGVGRYRGLTIRPIFIKTKKIIIKPELIEKEELNLWSDYE